ncbi:hypothetical protein Glove_217g82 [Diversispora epigaea]|uniref:Uncharacterized protein n=1 Tax=Diversispora epigaea TaxID=1348612 RepID=A0A397IQD3_9GLOM|nr:hypothetical protein Glove_217g82 [Diversispora epigaea]
MDIPIGMRELEFKKHANETLTNLGTDYSGEELLMNTDNNKVKVNPREKNSGKNN